MSEFEAPPGMEDHVMELNKVVDFTRDDNPSKFKFELIRASELTLNRSDRPAHPIYRQSSR